MSAVEAATPASIATRPFASPGAQMVDWEERVNPDRLRTYRLGSRAKAALAAQRRRRAAALRLQQHPLRHEHPHRRVGPRQDDPLRAPDAGRRAAPLGLRVGGQAPPAQLPVAAAGERPGRDDRAARRGGAGRRSLHPGRPRDRRDPPGRGRRRHADRRRHRRAADGRGPRRRGHPRPRRPADDAQRPRGQVAGRDHAAEHGLRDGRRRLPADRRAAEAGCQGEPARRERHEVPVRHGRRARRQHQRGLRRALLAPPPRVQRPDHPARRPGVLRHHPDLRRLQDLLLPDVHRRHRRPTPSATPTSGPASGSTRRSS